jgi:hypothetical protein
MTQKMASVLLIINSEPDDLSSVERILEALRKVVLVEDLWVIASSDWQGYLVNKGISIEQILLTRIQHEDLELNYFLESPLAINWIIRRKPQFIIGSVAHNVYNEEVKEILEKRVCFFLGQSFFIAHSLPLEYVYLLNFADLCERLGRQKKIASYKHLSQNILHDFYKLWLDRGKPFVDDNPDFEKEKKIFATHLGESILSFDEETKIPIQRPNIFEEVIQFWAETIPTYITILARLQEETVRLQEETVRLQEETVRLQEETVRLQEEINNLQNEIASREKLLIGRSTEVSYFRNRRAYPLIRMICRIEDKIKQIVKNI